MRTLLDSIFAVMTYVMLTAAAAVAQTHNGFPNKPVRIIVAFTPGGTPDTLVRLFAPKMSETWKQPVVVENRPGAGGAIAAAAVAKAAPDGHTLLMTSPAFAIAAALQPNLPYDSIRDFAGIVQFGNSTSVLVVPAALGIKSVGELIALANSQRILYGSAGASSAMHMNAERFKLATGIKGVHVGFKGQPECLLEVAASRVHFAVAGLGPALAFIKEGKLLPLAVTTSDRSAVLPDVPTLGEVLPAGWTRVGSQALLAPAGTPRPVLNQIRNEVARIVELPEIKLRFQSEDFQLALSTPDEFEAILRSEIEEFTKAGRAAGLIGR